MKKRRKKDEWLKLCEAFEGGDGTVVDFCKKHGLSRTSFHHWRCRLRDEVLLGARQPAFVEVSCDVPQRSQRIVVRLGEVSLEFFDGVPDPSWLAELAAQC